MSELKNSEDCIFCAIIAGRIPSARVYEDENIYAFLDLNPAAKGHTLVVPKFHAPTLLDLPDNMDGPVNNALKKIAKAILEETGADGFNCLQNNFSAAGQVVFHVHWHIIPRFEADKLFDFKQGKYDSKNEMNQIAQNLNRRLS